MKVKEKVQTKGLHPVKVKVRNRKGGAGVLTIVNSLSNTNSYRTMIDNEVVDRLGNPKAIQVGFGDETIAIGSYIGEGFSTFELYDSSSKKVIYNKALVQELIDFYKLDYSNRTSMTFYDVEYVEHDGNCIALIAINS